MLATMYGLSYYCFMAEQTAPRKASNLEVASHSLFWLAAEHYTGRLSRNETNATKYLKNRRVSCETTPPAGHIRIHDLTLGGNRRTTRIDFFNEEIFGGLLAIQALEVVTLPVDPELQAAEFGDLEPELAAYPAKFEANAQAFTTTETPARRVAAALYQAAYVLTRGQTAHQ